MSRPINSSPLKVRASIVAYKTDPEELKRCVGSLHRAGVSDVAVVDNSPDESLAVVCRQLSVSYRHTPKNLGYGAAHNIEMRRSLETDGVDYHLVINSDVWFHDDVIRKIVAHMDANPQIGQLIPATVYPDRSPQPVVRMVPTPLDLIARRFTPSFMFIKRKRRYLLGDWDHRRELNVPFHQGSFMFLRVEALRQIGLFDERFFMYPEDVDLTRRMHRRFETSFWPEVTIVHAHRAGSYHSLRLLRIHIVNMIRYFNKWGWFRDPERRQFNRRLLDSLRSLGSDSK